MVRFALVLAAACAAAAPRSCLSAEAPFGDAPLIGVAGVPRELVAARDNDRISAPRAAHGTGLIYPIFQHVEAPEWRATLDDSPSLGSER